MFCSRSIGGSARGGTAPPLPRYLTDSLAMALRELRAWLVASWAPLKVNTRALSDRKVTSRRFVPMHTRAAIPVLCVGELFPWRGVRISTCWLHFIRPDKETKATLMIPGMM